MSSYGLATTYVHPSLIRRGPSGLLGSLLGALGEPSEAAPRTSETVAQALLELRQAIARMWPRMTEAARAGRLPRAERAAWNALVDRLIDMELRFVQELSRAGVEDSDGRPLTTSVDTLYRTLRVGKFAGVPSRELGLVPLILPVWAAVALGVTLVGMAAVITIQSISSAEIQSARETATLFNDAIRAGVDPAEALRTAAGLEKERSRAARAFPAWAKGAALVGVVAIGGWAAYRLIPARGR